jgi:hypothetical protein
VPSSALPHVHVVEPLCPARLFLHASGAARVACAECVGRAGGNAWGTRGVSTRRGVCRRDTERVRTVTWLPEATVWCSSLRESRSLMTAVARGCVEPSSTDAAKANMSAGVSATPGVVESAATKGRPSVSVPVLSKTTVSTCMSTGAVSAAGCWRWAACQVWWRSPYQTARNSLSWPDRAHLKGRAAGQ